MRVPPDKLRYDSGNIDPLDLIVGRRGTVMGEYGAATTASPILQADISITAIVLRSIPYEPPENAAVESPAAYSLPGQSSNTFG